MTKWKVTYQVEESPLYERETKETTIETPDNTTEAEARLIAGQKVLAPMVQPGRPYIPFIYGSEKIEEENEDGP
jgi:hypothetical protein